MQGGEQEEINEKEKGKKVEQPPKRKWKEAEQKEEKWKKKI